MVTRSWIRFQDVLIDRITVFLQPGINDRKDLRNYERWKLVFVSRWFLTVSDKSKLRVFSMYLFKHAGYPSFNVANMEALWPWNSKHKNPAENNCAVWSAFLSHSDIQHCFIVFTVLEGSLFVTWEQLLCKEQGMRISWDERYQGEAPFWKPPAVSAYVCLYLSVYILIYLYLNDLNFILILWYMFSHAALSERSTPGDFTDASKQICLQ